MGTNYTVFKLRDGVEFGVNPWGCLVYCNDWETVYPADPVFYPNQKWRGTNRDLFQPGFGGAYFATDEFCNITGFHPIR